MDNPTLDDSCRVESDPALTIHRYQRDPILTAHVDPRIAFSIGPMIQSGLVLTIDMKCRNLVSTIHMEEQDLA